jgi:autotransporter-associated beta strand protein
MSVRQVGVAMAGLAAGWLGLYTGHAIAADYSWVGGGADNHWTTPENWQGGTGFPGAAGDTATVTAADGVHLNTNGVIMLGQLRLSGATPKTVTVTGDAGSGFTFGGIAAPNGGFLVDGHADNRLAVGTDIEIGSRIDKMGIGTVEFTGAVTSRVASGMAFVFGNGSGLFSGTSSLSAPSSMIGIGNGGWTASVVLTNQAVWRINRLEMGSASTATTRGYLTQVSDGCALTVAGAMILGQMNSAGNTNSFYALRKGTLAATTLSVGLNSPGAFEQSGGMLAVANLNVLAGTYRQIGGASEFANNLMVGAADKLPFVSLEGGTMRLNADMTATSTVSKQTFRFSGGVLQAPKTSSLRVPVRVDGNPVFDVPAGGSLTVREGLAGSAAIVKTGSSGLGLGSGSSAALSGSLTISNGVFNIGDKSELTSYNGSEEPLAVKICNGGILRLQDINSVVTVPLALDIDVGGKIDFPYGSSYNRGIVVAHTLATNGIPLPPGRYTTAHGFVTGGSAACSVVVPRVWTGEGDGESWSDAGNWAGGVVPNAAAESADLSRARGPVRLDGTVSLTCLIYNPQGVARPLTLTGGGALTLSVPVIVSPGLFIGPGRTLTLDVPLDRTPAGQTFAVTGGGTVVVKKGFPGIGAGQGASFSLHGDLVFAGETAMGNTFLGLWRHELNGDGPVVFTNGCRLTCQRILNNPSGFYSLRRVYHDGGEVTCGDVFFTRHNTYAADPYTYFMRSGTLTTTNANGICLGVLYSGAWARYPGGSFIMTGGTVNTARLAMGMPDNLFDLRGGGMNLGSGGIISTTNNVQGTVRLGGVALNATANWSSALGLELSGTNGPTVFDTAGRTVTLSGALSGAGGLVKRGAGTLNLNGATNTFTGPLVVADGTLTCGAASVFDGVSEIVVTNGTLVLNGIVLSPSLTVRVAGSGVLTLPAGTDLQVDRLWMGNSLRPAGTYTFGAGTVTVKPTAKIVWTGAADDGAKWSTLNNWGNTAIVPDGSDVALDLGYSQFAVDDQLVLDVSPGVTLTNLTFDQGVPGCTLTITCPPAVTNTLNFPANGVVRVEGGQTLVLDADILPAGNLYKDGLGTLVLNRRTWSGSAAAAFRLYIREGRVVNRGEINALSVQPSTASRLVPPPEFVQEGEGAAMRGKVFALPGYWTGSDNERGVWTQAGGTVDLSTIPDWVFAGKVGFMIAGGTGTEGVYTLSGGTLTTCTNRPAVLSGNFAQGVFNQSGGTSTFHSLALTMPAGLGTGGNGGLNLSGGTARFSGTVAKGSGTGAVSLGGGRIEALTDGAVFAEDVPVALVGGGTAFAQAQATFTSTLPGTLSGGGGLTQGGPGTLALTGVNTFGGRATVKGGTLLVGSALENAGELCVDGGALELRAATPALTNLSIRTAGATVLIDRGAVPFAEGMTLSLAQGVVTELDFDEIVEVDRLVIGEREMPPGLYGGPDSQAPVRPSSAFFAGPGTLSVLNGPPPSGTVMVLR